MQNNLNIPSICAPVPPTPSVPTRHILKLNLVPPVEKFARPCYSTSMVFSLSKVRCHDYVELLAELHLLPSFLSAHPKVRLLVIDSVASPFRPLFDEFSQRTRLLNGLSQQLITMVTGHDIAVVLTNQMTTRVKGAQSQLVPALGDTWGHTPTVRLLLQWAGSQRLVTILKSPCQMECTVEYQITPEGFRDANQSEEPQSKRTRTQAVSERQTSC